LRFENVVAVSTGTPVFIDENTSLLMHFDANPVTDETGKAIMNNDNVVVFADIAAIAG
jgi:hypothetical protein